MGTWALTTKYSLNNRKSENHMVGIRWAPVGHSWTFFNNMLDYN